MSEYSTLFIGAIVGGLVTLATVLYMNAKQRRWRAEHPEIRFPKPTHETPLRLWK